MSESDFSAATHIHITFLLHFLLQSLLNWFTAKKGEPCFILFRLFGVKRAIDYTEWIEKRWKGVIRPLTQLGPNLYCFTAYWRRTRTHQEHRGWVFKGTIHSRGRIGACWRSDLSSHPLSWVSISLIFFRLLKLEVSIAPSLLVGCGGKAWCKKWRVLC